MTDRELLEAAARAAGLQLRYQSAPTNDGGSGIQPVNQFGAVWNPLYDDGDALRLAVALHMGVQCNGPDHWQTPNCTIVLYGEHYRLTQPHAGDPRAATRHAIVRAAAAIGGAS